MPDTSFLCQVPAEGGQEPSNSGVCLPCPPPREEAGPQPTPVLGGCLMEDGIFPGGLLHETCTLSRSNIGPETK